MKKLASIVTAAVDILNMTHTDQLDSILASVKCQELGLSKMALSEAETQALFTTMSNQVERVMLWYDVTLNIGAHPV